MAWDFYRAFRILVWKSAAQDTEMKKSARKTTKKATKPQSKAAPEQPVQEPETIQAEIIPDYDSVKEAYDLAKEAEYIRIMEERNKLAEEMTKEEFAFCVHYLAGQTISMAQSQSGLKGQYVFYTYPKVQAYIKLARKLIELSTKNTQERILAELLKIVSVNPQEAYANGKLMAIDKIPKHVADTIQEIKETTIKGVKTYTIKFYSKLTALDMLAKHTGFYSVDNSQKESTVKTVFNIPFNGRDKKLAEANGVKVE
jgi:Terminase small subunit